MSLGGKQGKLDISAASGRRKRGKKKRKGHALGVKGQKSRQAQQCRPSGERVFRVSENAQNLRVNRVRILVSI